VVVNISSRNLLQEFCKRFARRYKRRHKTHSSKLKRGITRLSYVHEDLKIVSSLAFRF